VLLEELAVTKPIAPSRSTSATATDAGLAPTAYMAWAANTPLSRLRNTETVLEEELAVTKSTVPSRSTSAAAVVRFDRPDDVLTAIGRLSAEIAAKPGVCAEFTEQAGRRMVHLVNYREDGPAEQVAVKLRVPAGRTVSGVSLVSPEHDGQRSLTFEQRGDQVQFTVPAVNVYEIAVASWR